MKRRHRVPVEHMKFNEAPSADYMAQVERTTAKAARDYAAAQERLRRAEDRAAKAAARLAAKASKAAQREHDEAWALVELRRMELQKYERLMQATGAPATSRGTKSFRPVPVVFDTA